MHELYALKNEIKAHNEIVSSPNRIYCFQNNASACNTESDPCWGSGTETNNGIQCAAHSGLPPRWWSIFLVINCVRQPLMYQNAPSQASMIQHFFTFKISMGVSSILAMSMATLPWPMITAVWPDKSGLSWYKEKHRNTQYMWAS